MSSKVDIETGPAALREAPFIMANAISMLPDELTEPTLEFYVDSAGRTWEAEYNCERNIAVACKSKTRNGKYDCVLRLPLAYEDRTEALRSLATYVNRMDLLEYLWSTLQTRIEAGEEFKNELFSSEGTFRYEFKNDEMLHVTCMTPSDVELFTVSVRFNASI
uniref:Uncharacterized protein n=1 Tax=Pseudomonas phage RVTF4 TaxID=3236931 RepID=A0AB39CCJ8_9VIRU